MGWEALLEGQEGFGSPLEGLGGLWRVRKSQKVLPEDLEGSGVYSGGPKGMGRSSRRARRGRKLFWRARRVGRGQVALLEGWVGLRGSSGGPEGFGRVSRCWEALPDGREGPESPPGGSERVWRPSRRAQRGREAIPEGQEGSASTPGGPGEVRRHSRRAGRGRKARIRRQDRKTSLRVGRGWEAFPEGREGLGDPPGGTGVVGRPIRRAMRCREGSGGLSGGTKESGGVGWPSVSARVAGDFHGGQEGMERSSRRDSRG